MAALSSLPAAQRAVLSLVLEKGRTYDEIATLLQIDEAAVRERAHLALDALGPSGAPKPAPRHRSAIGNYLLGQQPDRAPATFAYLQSSIAGRDWARALAAELAELASGRLPPIPPDPDEPAPPPGADDPPDPAPAPPPPPPPLPPDPGPDDEHSQPDGDSPALPVSRRGGALLILGALVVIAAAAGAIILLGGGAKHRPAAVTPPASATTATRLAGQVTLSPSPGVRASGFAAIIQRGSQRVVAIAVARLQPTSAHLVYAAWLYNTPADSELVGYLPPVKPGGRISAAARLPADASRFRTLVLTRETGRNAARPGTVVLRGAVPAGAAG